MAGLKKPAKKPASNNPNTVLVVFLVMFVLTSIGLGVWGYYGYEGQEILIKKAKDAAKLTEANKMAADYYAFIGQELRLAMGGKLEDGEDTIWKDQRKIFLDDAGKYKDEKTRKVVMELLADLEKELGFNAQAEPPAYTKTFKQRITELAAALKAAQGQSDRFQKDGVAANARFDAYNAKHDATYADGLKRIDAGNRAALDAVSKYFKGMEAAFEENKKLLNEFDILKDSFNNDREKMATGLNKLQQEIAAIKQQKRDAVNANPGAGGQGGGQKPHALMLDVSSGRPLWDSPLGKITRVEAQDRQVVISLGAADGVRPELTFNVFTAWNNRADKMLKGTIEVVRVLDNNTSVARITSMYDADGHEILLNDPTRGRIQRESENAIKEGDLLFNVFWGTHVAIAGEVNWSEFTARSPAEQMRNLNQFMQQLTRQGVIIDAYLDLTDGTVKGAMTARTRYLIRGQPLYDGAPAGDKPAEKEGELKAPEPKENEKEKDKEMKAGEGAKEVGQARIQLVNDAWKAMRDEAVERGMFIISNENYANVVGYRRPRSANLQEISGFRPALPSASNLPPLLQPGGNDNPAPAPNNEKN